MIAVFLLPLYTLVGIYLVRWLILWLGACNSRFNDKRIRGLVIVLYVFFASAVGVGFLLPAGELQRFFKVLGSYWLGVKCYAAMIVMIADIISIILKRIKVINQEKLRAKKTFAIAGGFCMVFITAFCLWGAINAKIIHTTPYEITIDKSGGELKELNLVLVADLHLGYSMGCGQMERMVEKINARNPDLVVIAGDIFDNEYEALDDPTRLIEILKGIKSKYGVYACYGNHDIDEKILAGFTFSAKGKKKVSDPRMDEFLEAADIRLFMDEGVLIADSFYLYGRPDYERPGREITVRKTPKELTADMDQTHPIIVMDHEPRELQELSDAGVDLDLCGHTHDGQTFPGNLSTQFVWENSYGYLKKGSMHNIVTSGIGVFAPGMRVGTIAEICPIKIYFTVK